MSNLVSGIFGGKPDTSAVDAQRTKLKEQEAEQDRREKEQARRQQSSRSARSGRSGAGRSLLFGAETGVRNTLG